MTINNSRRTFLRTGAPGITGMTIIPASALGKSTGNTNRISPGDKLNIAYEVYQHR